MLARVPLAFLLFWPWCLPAAGQNKLSHPDRCPQFAGRRYMVESYLTGDDLERI